MKIIFLCSLEWVVVPSITWESSVILHIFLPPLIPWVLNISQICLLALLLSQATITSCLHHWMLFPKSNPYFLAWPCSTHFPGTSRVSSIKCKSSHLPTKIPILIVSLPSETEQDSLSCILASATRSKPAGERKNLNWFLPADLKFGICWVRKVKCKGFIENAKHWCKILREERISEVVF